MKGTCVLMHRNNKVATCTFDSRGFLKKISKIHDAKLLPIGIREESMAIDLQRWLLLRSLAPNRTDIAPLREFYGSAALLSSTGASLQDCYWFADENHIDWEQENPYDNWDCKNDSLYLMLAHPIRLTKFDTNSPNLTISGRDPKIWFRSKGNDICLLYGNAQKVTCR